MSACFEIYTVLNQNIYLSSDEYDFDIIRHDFVDDYQRRNVHTPISLSE